MENYDYVIIGGGITGDSAIAGIREIDPKGLIAMFSAERNLPYNRPLLSKGLWQGKPFDDIWRKTARDKVDVMLSRRITMLDVQRRTVTDSENRAYHYDKLLLATGGTARRLEHGEENVIYFRTLDDYRRLRKLADEHQRFAVIGGGFIGSELAAALARNGRQVVMIFPDKGIGARVFPPALSDFVTDYYLKQGIDVRPGETVIDVQPYTGGFLVRTASGPELQVHGVVAGVGLKPATELAEMAWLKTDNGIVVDQYLRTSSPAIFAAGDVAVFPNPALGKLIRVEHEDNARTMGKWAGRVMAGDRKPYTHLPFFYSDLFDLGYEAVGELNPQLDTFADWAEENRKGVIYYLDKGRVRGVLLWNVWDRVPAARELIAQPGPFLPADLKGRIPF